MQIAKGFGVRLPKSITHTFGERAIEVLPEFLRSALTGVREQIDTISDRQLRSADRRVGREASGTGAARKYSRRRPAHRDDVRAHAEAGRAIRTQPGCRGFLGLRPKRIKAARDPQLGISKSGDPYLRKLLVQCAHHIRARARKRPSERSSRWPGSDPCCCTAYG